MVEISTILSETQINKVREALLDGKIADIEPLTDDIIDVLVHLSFARNSDIGRRCFDILQKYEQRELEIQRELQRQQLLETLGNKNYDLIRGRESESIQLLLEVASSRNIENARRARILLSELEPIDAREALCDAALSNNVAAQICSAAQIVPLAKEKCSLFFALTEQWEKYSELDPSDELLTHAFNKTSRHLRKRLTKSVLQLAPSFSISILTKLALNAADETDISIVLDALNQITDEAARNTLCHAWSKSVDPIFTSILGKLGWVASKPASLKVSTALLTGNLSFLNFGDKDQVEALIIEAMTNNHQLGDSSLLSLENLTDLERIDQVCDKWWKSGNNNLRTLISKMDWIAQTPEELKIATLLLNRKFDTLENLSLNIVDSVLSFLYEKHPVNLSGEILAFLSNITSQQLIDRIWQTWQETQSKSLFNLLVENKRLAEAPLSLNVYSRLLIDSTRLDISNVKIISPLLNFANSNYEPVRESARLVLASLKSRKVIEELCRFAIRGNTMAKEVAVESGYVPASPLDHSKFLISLGNWKSYDAHDPQRDFLKQIYFAMDKLERLKFLQLLQSNNRIDLVSELIKLEMPSQLAERNVEEWQIILPALKQSERWDDIWLCAQQAVPLVSATLLRLLGVIGWEPSAPKDKVFFKQITLALRKCIESGPQTVFLGTANVIFDRSSQISVTADGKRLFSVLKDRRLRVRGLPAGDVENVYSLGTDNDTWIAVSSDGIFGASFSADGFVRIHRIADSKVLRKISLGALKLVKAIFTPNGQKLIFGTKQGVVCEIDIDTGNLKQYSAGVDGEITNLSISPNGELLSIGTRSVRIAVVKVRDGSLFTNINSVSKEVITAVAMNNTSVLLGDVTGALTLWDIHITINAESAQPPSCVGSWNARPAIPMSLTIANDGVFIAGTQDGKVLRGTLRPEFRADIVATLGTCVSEISTDHHGLVVASAVGTCVKVVAESLCRLSRLPLSQITESDVGNLQALESKPNLSGSDRAWCAFISDLYKWYHREQSEPT